MRSWMTHPLVILGAAALIIFGLFLARRTPEERPRPDASPLVRTIVARAEPHRFLVTSQGSVSPRRESDLIPQVTGEVVWVSPTLVPGGFFEAGDVLARIDPADYRVDRESARASVARAQSEFERARKERDRQRRLADRSVASEARIDDAENAYRVAEASLREARARLERAERDLARTEIKAPYRGRVRSEEVDLGQFVTRGMAIAKIYAVDYAEVRLPLPDRELAYLDLPLVPEDLLIAASGVSEAMPDLAESGERSDEASEALVPAPELDEVTAPTGARVTLEAEFAGRRHRWEGRLVRTEAELDPRSRMVAVVARIADPYGIETPRSAPLAVGLFVEATIEGDTIDRAFLLPRDALRGGNLVYVVDPAGHLRFRRVEVLRMERDDVVIRSGLEEGERVCTSPLQAAIDGMAVRLLEPEAIAEPTPDPGTPPEPAEGLAERSDETTPRAEALP